MILSEKIINKYDLKRLLGVYIDMHKYKEHFINEYNYVNDQIQEEVRENKNILLEYIYIVRTLTRSCHKRNFMNKLIYLMNI